MNAVSLYPIRVLDLDEPKGRVVLLERDALRRRVLERTLSRAGYVVEVAEDGADLVARVERGRAIDVVLVADDELTEGERLLSREVSDLDALLPFVRTGRLDAQAVAFETDRRAKEFQRVRRRRNLFADPLTGGDRGALDAAVTRAVKGLWVALQPVVACETGSLAYAVEVYTSDTTLPYLDAIYRAAEKLGRRAEVEGRVRTLVAERIARAPLGTHVFVDGTTH